MKPLLKWPGGKTQELDVILDRMPNFFGRYIEPFLGGGAVFFATDYQYNCINDKSKELMNLYQCIRNKDNDLKSFLNEECTEFEGISKFIDSHKQDVYSLYNRQISTEDFIRKYSSFFSGIAKSANKLFKEELQKNLSRKIKRSHDLEKKNGVFSDEYRLKNMETAIKSAYYMYIRYLLNNCSTLTDGQYAAVFFFIREFCYSSMFRYNNNGDFNVPYGGMSYNDKNFRKKIKYILSDEMYNKLSTADIFCLDFADCMDSINVNGTDFIFLDPPYDTEFSSYSNNKFDQNEQVRLRDFLAKTPAKFMLIIKNNEFIYSLYDQAPFIIHSFDKQYQVNFKNRNAQKVKHLIITNY